MTDISPAVDIEAVLVAHLKADLDFDKVSTELPSSFPDGKRVRLFRFAGASLTPETNHLDRPVVQVESYGATRTEAFDLANEIILSILRMPAVDNAFAVVTGAEVSSGPRWSPDDRTDAPRYLLDVILYAHALPG